jgi:hypothetical protein
MEGGPGVQAAAQLGSGFEFSGAFERGEFSDLFSALFKGVSTGKPQRAVRSSPSHPAQGLDKLYRSRHYNGWVTLQITQPHDFLSISNSS